ncbi:hypothetical protein DM860_001675 [Cuscuta australis]|uniref:Integrator complex subunit 3 N-terminal domain-containing protein n=1 Tax=Cuscuta australis TaxID=267555 RepID=A0A328E9K2_9ASTE|nr:hypothetical protein DM860_001675 [Cuscuta australis]
MAGSLIRRATHDAENPLEASLREAFNHQQGNLRPPFSLKSLAQEQYPRLNDAILFGILLEPRSAKTHIKLLHAIISDGYCHFTSMVTRIVDELYSKLVDSAKIQLIWVAREMVDVVSVGFDGLLVALLRQIVGGDFSEGNLWLCSEMVGVFLQKWDRLVEENPLILTYGLYVFLRILADHGSLSGDSRLNMLKKLETEFCIRVLRERFDLCLKIGRDLVRLLQDLVHIAEFKSIWKDLLFNPGEFRVNDFKSMVKIYRLKTQSLYFSLRITPEMERNLRFLLTNVKFGNQKRYQAWFAKKFLSCSERETLLVDIARFICCTCRSSSEGADILPRWAVIGWLLMSCRKSYIEANFKLALFYDWLFFCEEGDDVMRAEPAILLMANSIPKYSDITNALLEFLLILIDNYDAERKDVIVNGVLSVFHALLMNGVIDSLDVLAHSDALSPVLREMLKKLLSFMETSHTKELQ